MRLWHQALIHYLPRQQLLGQHRECCALRGKGWGKKHSVVDYVFKNPYYFLYGYHCEVMREMTMRGYAVNSSWYRLEWRGNAIGIDITGFVGNTVLASNQHIYDEHDDNYLKECLDNLEAKGAELVNGESVAHMKLMLMLKKGI